VVTLALLENSFKKTQSKAFNLSTSIPVDPPVKLPSNVWIGLTQKNDDNLYQCILGLDGDSIPLRNADKSNGVIWIPTAKTRPGSSIKGFVLARDINALIGKMKLTQ